MARELNCIPIIYYDSVMKGTIYKTMPLYYSIGICYTMGDVLPMNARSRMKMHCISRPFIVFDRLYFNIRTNPE